MRRALPGASLPKIPEAIQSYWELTLFRTLVWSNRRPPDVLASEDFRANGHGGPVTSLPPRSAQSRGARDGAAVEGNASAGRARCAQGVCEHAVGRGPLPAQAASRGAPHLGLRGGRGGRRLLPAWVGDQPAARDRGSASGGGHRRLSLLRQPGQAVPLPGG